jgi:hypothetical protein
VGLLLVAALVLGTVAVALAAPELQATGPTSVRGTQATRVFTVGARKVRQVRYTDGKTLSYTFRVTNTGRMPVDVLGLAKDQEPSRLLHVVGLDIGSGLPVRLGAGETVELTLAIAMSGCETLSARAGAFVGSVRVHTRQAWLFADDVVVSLPEALHTGSPREAFCPNSTATSRPPG